MENQHAESSLTASQDYLNEHMPAGNSGNWMNKVTSAIPDSIKQYGTTAANQVKNMSTTQKIAGGAIIAASALYLANMSTVNGKIQDALSSRNNSRNKNKVQ